MFYFEFTPFHVSDRFDSETPSTLEHNLTEAKQRIWACACLRDTQFPLLNVRAFVGADNRLSFSINFGRRALPTTSIEANKTKHAWFYRRKFEHVTFHGCCSIRVEPRLGLIRNLVFRTRSILGNQFWVFRDSQLMSLLCFSLWLCASIKAAVARRACSFASEGAQSAMASNKEYHDAACDTCH